MNENFEVDKRVQREKGREKRGGEGGGQTGLYRSGRVKKEDRI